MTRNKKKLFKRQLQDTNRKKNSYIVVCYIFMNNLKLLTIQSSDTSSDKLSRSLLNIRDTIFDTKQLFWERKGFTEQKAISISNHLFVCKIEKRKEKKKKRRRKKWRIYSRLKVKTLYTTHKWLLFKFVLCSPIQIGCLS